MFIFLYTVFRNSSISDEHVFCVALHFTIGQSQFHFTAKKILFFQNKRLFKEVVIKNSYVTTYIGADKVSRLSKYKFESFKQSD